MDLPVVAQMHGHQSHLTSLLRVILKDAV